MLGLCPALKSPEAILSQVDIWLLRACAPMVCLLSQSGRSPHHLDSPPVWQATLLPAPVTGERHLLRASFSLGGCGRVSPRYCDNDRLPRISSGALPILTDALLHPSYHLCITRGETEAQRQEAGLSSVSDLGTSKAESLGRFPVVLVETPSKVP